MRSALAVTSAVFPVEGVQYDIGVRQRAISIPAIASIPAVCFIIYVPVLLFVTLPGNGRLSFGTTRNTRNSNSGRFVMNFKVNSLEVVSGFRFQ